MTEPTNTVEQDKTEQPKARKRGGFRRGLFLAMLAVIIGLVVAIVVAFCLLRSEPAYVAGISAFLESKLPQELDEMATVLEKRIIHELSRPGPTLVAAPGRQTNKIGNAGMSKAVDVRTISVSFDEVNAWLAARLRPWLAYQNRRLPKEITSPMVAIDNDTLVVMLRYELGRISQLIIFDVQVTVEEGQQAKVKLLRVRGGRLPLPAATASKLMAKWSGSSRRGAFQKLAQSLEGISITPVRPIDDVRFLRATGFAVRSDGVDMTVRVEPRRDKKRLLAARQNSLRNSVTGEKPLFMQDWIYFWNDMPAELRTEKNRELALSNIAPEDYSGPESCAKCHEENYQRWSEHPHRWMNAAATSETVKGRFDGSELKLRGGRIRMYQEDGQYWMHVQRGELERLFRVTHTIGSRFLQYYIGILEQGDPVREPVGGGPNGSSSGPNVAVGTKMVLPAGYVLRDQRWGPATQVFAHDDTDDTSDPYEGFIPVRYYRKCAHCHTVVPQGYRLLWDMNAIGLNKPPFHFEVLPFLQQTMKGMADRSQPPSLVTPNSLKRVMLDVITSYGPEHAVTVGISCEGCHYGSKAHAESKGTVPPRFLPSSPHIAHSDQFETYARTRQNVNLVCAQCHSTSPRKLPGGIARRNSAEYRDAIAGSCYSQLTCIQCHEPHTATGREWSNTPDQDDASCLKCHQQYQTTDAIEEHTHHRAGTEGSRCMNCHMPKVTEGLLDMVRSHQITSPNSRRIVTAGGINACNLCHLDQSIDWTLNHIKQWYGTTYDRGLLDRRYPDTQSPAGLVWITDKRPEFRLVALGAIKRRGAHWLAQEVVRQLDDSYVVHRQFAQNTLEQLLEKDLGPLGYHYWLTPKERQPILQKIHDLVPDHSILGVTRSQ